VKPESKGNFEFSVNVKKLYKALKHCEGGVLVLEFTDEILRIRCTTDSNAISVNWELKDDTCIPEHIPKEFKWKYILCMNVDKLKKRVSSAKDFDCNQIAFRIYSDKFEIALMTNSRVICKESWRSSQMNSSGMGEYTTYQIGGSVSGAWSTGKPLLQLVFQEDMINRILKSMSGVTIEMRMGSITKGGFEPPLAIIRSLGLGLGKDAAVIKFFVAAWTAVTDMEE
jgi:hypothetical protein